MLETLVLKPFMYLWSINKIRGKKWERNAQSSLWDTWISPKLFVDRLNAWINGKLVSGEVRKLFFSVVKREFNSRHYNIMHFLLWICRAWTWWRFTAIKVCERLRSALDPIGHSPFLPLWNLHQVELFSAIISHLDDISSWKCSWKCKSLQFKRKNFDA